jgi:hypothetical protein
MAMPMPEAINKAVGIKPRGPGSRLARNKRAPINVVMPSKKKLAFIQ